jgi:peroxiredoxin
MGTAVCLFACALTMAQPPERGGWLLAPQLSPGLELVYSGTCTQEDLIPRVQYQRTFKLDTTILVLAAKPRSWDVAIMTVVTVPAKEVDAKKEKEFPNSVRLELAAVDKHGRISGPADSNLAISLAGPPGLDSGLFVEVPPERVGREQVWEVNEEGRPPRTWQVVGMESCAGVSCVKLVGQQQSEDWDRPRADRTAWRRRDTVWIAPPMNLAMKVERVIERRDPLRREPTARTTVTCDLASRFTYPGKLFDDRRNEVSKARKFWADSAALLKQPAEYRGQLDALHKRITFHLDSQPPTPYRKALAFLQKRVEIARRGELPPEPIASENVESAVGVRPGQRAPDFVATDLTSKESARLYRQLGKPVLLFFYSPGTDNGKEVLQFARGLNQKYSAKVGIVGLAATEDADLVRKQHAQLRLPFPILDGQGLRLTFGVEATPRLLVLDADGIVRAAHTGWGHHTAREIEEEFQRCFPR